MPLIADTPSPPYYAEIFTSIRSAGDNGYHDMAQKLIAAVVNQPGFLGVEFAREGVGLTISYWESLEAIENWREHMKHAEARQMGRDKWYLGFKVRICKVERDYDFFKS